MSSRCNADSDYISSKSWLLKNWENGFQTLNNYQTGSIGNDLVSNTCYSACQGYTVWTDPPPALRIRHSEEGLSPLSNSETLLANFERTNPYIDPRKQSKNGFMFFLELERYKGEDVALNMGTVTPTPA